MALSQQDIDAIVSSVNNTLGPQLASLTSQITKVQEIYDLMGLNVNSPLIVGQTQRTVGGILQSITIDENTHTTTVRRILAALGIGSSRVGVDFRVG